MKYEFHPLANAFPMMEGKEKADLVEDIRRNGLQESIKLYQGKILDGRNRTVACVELGIEPRFETYTGDDPMAFVWSENVTRRHLNEGAKTMIGKKLLELNDEWIAEVERIKEQTRAARSEAKIGNQNAVKNNSSDSIATIVSESPKPAPKPKVNVTRNAAAAFLKVSPTMMQIAETLENRAPDLVEPVIQQKITLTQANRMRKEREREAKRQENAKKVEQAKAIEPGLRFSTIVIDPPWDWGDEGDKDQLGRAKPDYATMSIQQLLGLPVAGFRQY